MQTIVRCSPQMGKQENGSAGMLTALSYHLPEARERMEQAAGILGLDFVEVVEGLAAGSDGGGDHAGFSGLADVVVGVADVDRPDDIVHRLGVPIRNTQRHRRPAHRGHDRLIGLDQRPAKVRDDQIDLSPGITPPNVLESRVFDT
jgi:hypothetical protein